MNPSELARFMAKIEVLPSGCWQWNGALLAPTAKRPWAGGYGLFHAGGRTRLAHRVSYEHFVGPIPLRAVLDHLCHGRDKACPGGLACRHRRCVNWVDLEAVTSLVNAMRGQGPTATNVTKTHCPRGHVYDEANTYTDRTGRRHCRTCRRSRTQMWYAEQGGAAWHQNYHQTVRKAGN